MFFGFSCDKVGELENPLQKEDILLLCEKDKFFHNQLESPQPQSWINLEPYKMNSNINILNEKEIKT